MQRFGAGSGHDYHRFHASPLLRSNAHICQYSPSPFRALISLRYSNKHHHVQDGDLLHPGNPIWTSYRPSPALPGAFIASCCARCFCTRTGRRHASLRFWAMGTRNHTHLGLLTPALLSSTFSLKSKTGLMVARAVALRTLPVNQCREWP